MFNFINELSFIGQASDRYSADQKLQDIFTIMNSISTEIPNVVFSSSSNLWGKMITPNLKLDDAIYQTNMNINIKRLFRVLLSKGPYVESLLEENFDYRNCKFRGNDVTDSSLSGAFYFKTGTISISDSQYFDSDIIRIQQKERDCEYVDTEIDNIFNPIEIESYIAKLIYSGIQNINSWNEFWERKEEIFNSINFCENVIVLLNKLPFSRNWKTIYHHLSKMNNYYNMIKRTNSVPDWTKIGVACSTETRQTLHHFGDQRKFLCPDGENRIFVLHSKMVGENLRIHFFPPENSYPDFTIGYIGPHLSTMKYRH